MDGEQLVIDNPSNPRPAIEGVRESSEKLELHYFTFGLGHTFAGHVQPILDENYKQAQKVIMHTYGDKWAFHYTEDEWESSKMRGFAKEKSLDLIDARKVVI